MCSVVALATQGQQNIPQKMHSFRRVFARTNTRLSDVTSAQSNVLGLTAWIL